MAKACDNCGAFKVPLYEADLDIAGKEPDFSPGNSKAVEWVDVHFCNVCREAIVKMDWKTLAARHKE